MADGKTSWCHTRAIIGAESSAPAGDAQQRQGMETEDSWGLLASPAKPMRSSFSGRPCIK